MFGNCGKNLYVDLSTGEVTTECYPSSFARMFLGGNGFAAKLIYDRLEGDVDPLGSDNAIVFTVGPLTDTPFWGTSRGHIAAISPQTGFFADSNYGGNFAVAQKRTGFDAVFITGRASEATYLLLTDDGCELKDAREYWGMTTEQTNHALEQEEGTGSVSISIGPAGENMVVFACMIGGGKRPGAAGRGGMGAVMGAKNLKAVVARGTLKTEIAQPEKLIQVRKRQLPVLKEGTAVLSEVGTPFLVDMINGRGVLCTHNASRETFEFSAEINATRLRQQYIVRNSGCFGCPVACGASIFDRLGIPFMHLVMTDHGVEKGKTVIGDRIVAEVVEAARAKMCCG